MISSCRSSQLSLLPMAPVSSEIFPTVATDDLNSVLGPHAWALDTYHQALAWRKQTNKQTKNTPLFSQELVLVIESLVSTAIVSAMPLKTPFRDSIGFFVQAGLALPLWSARTESHHCVVGAGNGYKC